MKRRITAVVLVLLLITASAQTASADSSGLCFTATNDYLLDLGSMTAFVSGISYVPAKVFSTYGVYYNYFESKSTAMLYNGNKEIFFDLISGNSYDSAGATYSVSATFQYGQVYVPVAWVCVYFGLGYSYINGTGFGDVLRLKNGKEVLTDTQFFDAASTLIRSRYNEYYGNVDPVSPSPSSPKPSDSDANSESISLCFIGLPSDDMLDVLDNYSEKVCFFVTSEEASDSPDTIRRICGSGHSIGIYCKANPESECQAAADIIFEVAQVRPMLIASPAAIAKNCSSFAENNGYAYLTPTVEVPITAKYALSVTSELDNIKGFTSISIFVTENSENFLPYVLQRISADNITNLPLTETLI